MPRYELMYLLGSHVADNDVPAIASQVLKFIEELGGTDIVENHLGKKKLAYPIKKTRNGYYVVVNFSMDSSKIGELEAKIRTQDSNIIRHLIANLEEHLKRMEKDRIEQAKLTPRKPPVAEAESKPEPATKKEPAAEAPLLEIDQEELDKKIEEALSEDLTK